MAKEKKEPKERMIRLLCNARDRHAGDVFMHDATDAKQLVTDRNAVFVDEDGNVLKE